MPPFHALRKNQIGSRELTLTPNPYSLSQRATITVSAWRPWVFSAAFMNAS